MLRGLFITGTDTNVGKTVVAAALFHRYQAECRLLRYWKPVQTGVEQDDDTATVRLLTGCAEDHILDKGVRLSLAASPHFAAQMSGQRIDLGEIVEIVSGEPGGAWIVEGAGGVLVPLNESVTIASLMAELAMPVVIVARSGLGTINHTLLTVEALRTRQLRVAGVVMVGLPSPENRAAIERYGEVAVLGELPMLQPLTRDTLSRWACRQLDATGILRPHLE